ncbi:hypothetical protein G7048_12025 [Diaphorobacter sp. HDW4B]|uniref:hypothetical protein n=1 Tax=Diaphorobacter sp. HDW4B TaxID=2714925 RepID=UPI00140C5D89|nr:hypothetical protein [Diaphorobacter sp. HDW4B]QIL71022.1 hypothetical protein G7048_12025 [Diaphorobacter sp. HDW4B]
MKCVCGAHLSDTLRHPVSKEAHDTLCEGDVDVAVLKWIGSLEKYGLQGKPGKKAAITSLADVIDVLERGSRIVCDWPKSFESLLDNLRLDQQNSTASLASAALPFLSKRVRSIRDPAWRDRISNAVIDYIHSTRFKRNALLSRNVPNDSNLKSVAKRLGASTERVSRLLESAKHPALVTRCDRKRYSILPSTEDLLRSRIADIISIKSAASALGMSRARTLQLIGHGTLQALDNGVSHQSLDRFQDLLLNLAANDRNAQQAANLVPLRHALRVVVPQKMTLTFFDAVRSGELSLYLLDKSIQRTGTERLHVSPLELATWLAAYRDSQSSMTDFLDITRAAHALGIKSEVISQLISRGLLRTTKPRQTSRSPVEIMRSEIEGFLGQYVPLKHLATQAGIAPKHAPAWARTKGIKLVTGPSIDGCRQYFALRPKECIHP